MRKILGLLSVLPVAVLLLVAKLHLRADTFSARAQPSRVEGWLAGTARTLATPATVRDRKNPVGYTSAALQEGMAHYADHCAICHGNDGSGQTMLGQGMYPKPPDMRNTVTQSKTDGELFSLIENGVRLSGMPAFGGNSGTEEESWKLVAFLKHLPTLSSAELQMMQRMNPKSPEEMEEEKQEEDFLSGAASNDESGRDRSNRKHGSVPAMR